MALPHSKDIFDYPARFQFGQAGAPCGGSSCCTDTCIQMIVEFYREKTFSLAYIRNKAQALTRFNEGPCTGINHVEVLNALKALGVGHYRAAFGVDASFVAQKSAIGPVIVGVHYGSYPKSSTGRCGSTNKAERYGKTDCGFNGAHAVLAVGPKVAHRNSSGTFLHWDIRTRDPDHNSPARPEKPSYDRITLSQLNTTMRNLPRYTPFKTTYCVYPTVRK